MPLVINNEIMKGALNEHFRTKKRPLSDLRLTERVLLEACPYIEEHLGDPKYLRGFSWMGRQAFYNDEPQGQKEAIGLLTGQGKGVHLAENFRITANVMAGGYGVFVIHNDKTVTGKNGRVYNLFDLLWYGFGPYQQPSPKKIYKRLTQDEIFQMNWKQRRAWRRGESVYYQTPMTFYYRYAGRWFYKMLKRGGFNPSLHDKFKQYIFGAIEYGLERALKNIIKSGKGSDAMKDLSGVLGGLK